MKNAKQTLDSGEKIARVLTVTSKSDVYEALPGELHQESIDPSIVDAMATTYTLEQSSNPAFAISNFGAAERYRSQMGGYMMIVKGGKVYAAKLSPSNWNNFADGTPVGDASRFETMVKLPPCHFKASGQTMQFGGLIPIGGGHTFDAPTFVGAYEMYVDSSGKGHSRPDVIPSYSRTMTDFDTCAKKNGSEWGLANYGFFCLINALYQARFGNLDSQTIIGPGFQHSEWSAARDVPMGLTRSLGDGSGKVYYNDATLGDQYPVKLFGFEDLWGKLWEFRPGIRYYMDGDVRKAVIYGGNQVSNTATGREVSGVDKTGGYIKAMMLGEHWDMVAKTAEGSPTTYYCDYHYASTSGALLVVGGHSYSGSLCGLSCSASNSGFSLSYSALGARLAFYGEPEYVSGAQLVTLAGA